MSLNYISVTPNSPIRIGKAKPSFSFLPTDIIIPGSIIRGAVAEYLINKGKRLEIKNFISDMRFGFAYPSPSPHFLPFPLPTTALTCKTHGGFKSKKECHGIFDSLLAMIAYEELKKIAKFPVPFTFTCPICESRADRVLGFYIQEENNYKKIESKMFSQTKVAINRYRKTSEKEMLYSITALKPKGVFLGKIFANDEKLEETITALNKMGIGAHTTRGYGKIKAEKSNFKIDSLETRLEAFNEKLREVWSDISSISINKNDLPEEPQATYFSVDLFSPLILKSNGIPTLKLSLNLNGNQIEPILFSVNSLFVGGWSTAWGLPKETTYAAGIGSTYVFKIEEPISNLSQELEKIETNGLGERKEEGYGDILICHSFHKEVIPV